MKMAIVSRVCGSDCGAFEARTDRDLAYGLVLISAVVLCGRS